MLRIAIALVAAGLSSFASLSRAQICTPFIDVPASDPFCSNIQWMFNRGVTFGCTANQYCPANSVRRDQMAAFMFRLSHDVVFQEGGNAFGNSAVLGTTDNNSLDVRVNNARVMRYEPNAVSPNIVGGSPANHVAPGVRGATIGGGGAPVGDTDPDYSGEAPNRVTAVYGTVGGGWDNQAGGSGEIIDGSFATVGGGRHNAASGGGSTVAGGVNNTASASESTVGGGNGNTASGAWSTIAGGTANKASGFASFAAGRFANANSGGCFVWGDNSTTSTGNEVRCDAPNRFVVRSVGGVFIWAGGTSQATYFGVELRPNDIGWVQSSDRRLKENLQAVDPGDVLERVVALPITTWNVKAQESPIRHMGAMAQDFRAAFGLGDSDVGINTIDADGVALAAIQGLNAKVDAQAREMEAMRTSHAAEIAALRHALERLLARER